MFSFAVIAVVFGVIFLAELPDKTALAGLMLGTRYRPSYVFAGVAAAFYQKVFGFEIVANERGGAAIFMRSASGDNHHDLGLFSVGPQAPRAPRGSVGLYHLAWEVPTIEDRAAAAQILSETGALGGASDHGVSKSLYGADPDGNEFEVMWMLPRDAWGELANAAPVERLDLAAEVARWSGVRSAGRIVPEEDC